MIQITRVAIQHGGEGDTGFAVTHAWVRTPAFGTYETKASCSVSGGLSVLIWAMGAVEFFPLWRRKKGKAVLPRVY